MRTDVLCISVLRVASGPRVKLASFKSALNYAPPPPPHTHTHHTHTQPSPPKPTPTPVVYSTDRSKAVVPVLVLLFVALWFILRGNLFYVLPCVNLFLCFFSPLSIAITSRWQERANLSAFRTFVFVIDLRLFGFVCFLFLLVFGKGCGLWLSGLFSYIFCIQLCNNLIIYWTTKTDKNYLPTYVCSSSC